MREGLIGLLERAEGLDPLARMEAAEALEQSEDPALLLTTLRSLLRDVAALRAGADAEALVHPDAAERLAPLARGRLGERAALARRAGGGGPLRPARVREQAPHLRPPRRRPRRRLRPGRRPFDPCARAKACATSYQQNPPLDELRTPLHPRTAALARGPRRRGLKTWRPGT